MAFEVLTVDQVIERLKGYKFKISQIHHTWKPDHSNFNGKNHLQLQQGMRDYHVNNRGWSDIGQHLTLMPDGKFVTGRSFKESPAGITGYNSGAFMVEMLGNFDKGHDKLEGPQLEAILKLQNFLVTSCGADIMFHNEHAAKSCPGTGINKDEFVRKVMEYGKVKAVSEEAKVTFNGKEIPAFIKDGHTYSQVRDIAELLGLKIVFNNESKTIKLFVNK